MTHKDEERRDRFELRLARLEADASQRANEVDRLARAVADLAHTIDLDARGVLR